PVTHDAPAVFPLGITTVTFSATDLSANTGQAQATVNITDQTPPVISLIGASSMTLNVGDIFSDPGHTVTDNVNVGLSATVTGSVNTTTVGTYPLNYNVSDTAGNVATQITRTVSVVDNVSPDVTAPANITVAAIDAVGTANTAAAINTFLNAATATDTVDGPRPVTHDAPAVFPLGITTVTFSATDLSANTGQAQATVNITDQTPPVISLIGASSMTLNVGDIFSDPGHIVTDNVNVGLSATVMGSVNTAIVGLYTLTYNVSDTAGNASIIITRSISIQDSNAPVVTPPANITVAATDAAGTANSVAAINAFLNAATATDAVDGPRSVTHDAPTTFPLGLTTVTFSATDLSANTGQAQATVNITDQTPPVISLIGASSMTLNVGDIFSDPGHTVTDNVNVGLSASVTGSVNTAIVGLYTLTYNVSDAAGNAAIIATRSVSVQDSAAPVVTPPANITVAATNAAGTANSVAAINVFLSAATATDAIDGVRTVTHDAPVTFPLGITTVTFSATDLSGNTGQAQATVNITDQTPPVISLIGASSMPLNVGDIFSDPGASVTDNVNAGLSASVTGSVNTAIVGLYTLTYNVSDAAGNAAIIATRSVSVQDSAAPVVTPSANITVAATNAAGTANTAAAINAFLNAATATDTIDGVRTVTHDAPVTFPLGITTVTFSATDLSANTGQAQATVNITDQTPPVISLIGASSMTLNVGDIFSDPGSSVSDNVDVGLVATVIGNVNTAIPATYILSYNINDAAGNAAITVTRSLTVLTVQDNAVPVVTPPANITVAATNAAGTANTVAAINTFLNAATATDAVDGPRPVTLNAPVTFPLGITTVTFSATDLSGNTGQAQATVNITDQTSPVISLIGASLIALNVGDIFSDPGHTVTDNVNEGLSAIVTGSVNTAIVGLYTLTYNVSDAAGNAAVTVIRSVNITTSVNAPPVITAPMDIVIPSLGAVTPVTFGAVEAIDDEDGVILASPDNSGPFVPGRHPILWSATDSSGNTGLAIQFVDVLPLVEFPPDQLSEPGMMLSIPVILNGLPAIYPVEVNYDVFEGSSSIASDSGSILVIEGIEGYFDYMMPASGDITFEITSVMNAVKGPMATHKVTVINQNVEPLSILEITQNSLLTRIIAKDAGPVTVKNTVQDTNPLDTHSFDWSQTDNVLLASNPGLSDSQFTFEPSSLSPGLVKINVKVTDNGGLFTSIETSFKVLNTAPVFIEKQDSDGDGIDDEIEGYDDSDNDGIPDYLDGVENLSAMQGKEGISDKWLLNVQPGLAIRLGDIPLLADQHTANITAQDIENIAGSFGGVVPAEAIDTFTNTGGYFDFEITGLTSVGQSALIVIPQYAAIPANAAYRKYTTINGWMDFVEDSKNKLSSAVGEEGVCPAPGDSAYQHNDGLVEGDYCVQLLIEDGGPNDADSLKNGVIADPGGVAVAAIKEADPVIPAPANTSSGGGSINILTLILLLGMYRLQLRYRNRDR
ncbi:MAG: DUF5011 domain-containing protein, partial [Gammaproteobacteria bacterium]|nr:DUF5011 domain-containing protein [Gammaproteobacteria bacterium]